MRFEVVDAREKGRFAVWDHATNAVAVMRVSGRAKVQMTYASRATAQRRCDDMNGIEGSA